MIEANFERKPLTEAQAVTREAVVRRAQEFAGLLNDCIGQGRELSLALTKLEECVMWADAAITRPKNPFPSKSA